nr:uncharacterized protein LOC107129140 [Macaca fascicularis]
MRGGRDKRGGNKVAAHWRARSRQGPAGRTGSDMCRNRSASGEGGTRCEEGLKKGEDLCAAHCCCLRLSPWWRARRACCLRPARRAGSGPLQMPHCLPGERKVTVRTSVCGDCEGNNAVGQAFWARQSPRSLPSLKPWEWNNCERREDTPRNRAEMALV